MSIDLHSHTTASDGHLAPSELLARAREYGVRQLAITDHDSLAAYDNLPLSPGVQIVSGIELSTRWRKHGVHIVGLNVDRGDQTLLAGIGRQQEARHDRAVKIAQRLVKLGFDDPLPEVTRLAGGGNIGRPHFARHLVASGRVRNEREAFRKYLGAGKAGDVREKWADFEEVIGWIRGAGGVAVVAHPAHYGMTATRLRELLAAFVDAGGEAMEVVSGRQDESVSHMLAVHAADFGLLASQGSDFHRPGTPWAELGRCSPMPDGCRPVWERWS